MSARRSWCLVAAGAAVALLAGCPEEFPQKPQIQVLFQEPNNPFNFGKVFVGTSAQSTIAITNKGLENLEVASITLSGDPVFTRYRPSDGTANPTHPPEDAGVTVPPGTLTIVTANRSSYYTLTFTPTADRSYTGTATIQSNAENSPSVEIPVLGTGCAQDLPDGGRPPGSLCTL